MAFKHGESGTPLYIRWKALRQRVAGKYAHRQIAVDPEWDDYTAFRDWAVTAGYRPDLTLDRIDNDGPYGPENCRWVTMAVQNQNKRPPDLQRSRNRKIFRRDWPSILERYRRGESAASIAADYGVSVARIYGVRHEAHLAGTKK